MLPENFKALDWSFGGRNQVSSYGKKPLEVVNDVKILEFFWSFGQSAL